MTGRTHETPQDAGETLIEILIAVAIMGLVMVGLVAALTTATIASDNHRRLSDVEIVARAYGEAVLSQALHPVPTALTTAAATGDSAVFVNATGAFTSGATASVDGEVVIIQSVSAGKLTLSNNLIADHAAASPVMPYQPCPDAASLQVAAFTYSAIRVDAPTITQIEYFAQPSGPALPVLIAQWAGVGTAPTACTNFWSTTGLPCSLDQAPKPHYTACDPPLIRVTIAVNGTEGANNPRRATTTTRVFVNRGNA